MPTRTWLILGLALAAHLACAPAHADEVVLERGSFDAATRNVGDVVSRQACPGAFQARARAPRKKDWRFAVAPYGWLASVDGSVVSGGESADVSIPFSDLADAVNGGFQLYLEARWRRFFVAFDGTWANLTPYADSVLLGLIDVKVDVDQRLFDMRVGYQLFRCTLDGPLDPCCEPWRRWMQADVFVGVRYWYTKISLDLQGRGPLGLGARFDSVDERWDPFVGARFEVSLTRHWSLAVRGDIGGFGIGDAAELAWQVSGGVGYRLTPWMQIILGWRAIGFDTVTGSGVDRSGADLVQHGPIIGLGFTF